MSDTPRTDCMMKYCFGDDKEFVPVEKAKELERELTAAQAEIARLKAGGCARDQRTTQFCGEALKLQEENAKLQERVKRLEEALDTLTLVVGLTPIAGNKEALQEAVDIARSELKAKDTP